MRQYTSLSSLAGIPAGLYYRATVTDSQGQTASSPYNFVTNSSSGGGGGGDPCLSCPDELPGNRLADATEDTPMLVYPVPATDAVTIRYTLEQQGAVTLRLTDTGGKTIHSEVYDGNATGMHTVTTSLAGIPAGLYYMLLQTPGRVQTYRLIKE